MSTSLATLKKSENRSGVHRDGYQQCTRCVMDTSDPDITFGDDGICNNCSDFLQKRSLLVIPPEERERELRDIVERIRASGRRQRYDCIVGVSGGVDSTYVAYLAQKLMLRPLCVHVDNGWDSELAVGNIEKVLKKLNIDLYTYVIDWEEFRDLQIAFLRSSTVDADLPTDHAIRAVLRRVASRENVSYSLNGRNFSTEGLLPWGWAYSAIDWKYLRSVHAKFGTRRLRSFPHQGLPQLLYSVSVRRIQNIGILNYVPYDKETAHSFLVNELGWKDYGGKHFESIFTRFFQGYVLPTKFGIDLRKAYLSTLICTDQITREAALKELQHPPLSPERAKADQEYVLKKFRLSTDEFAAIMAEPPRTYEDFPNNSNLFLLHKSQRTRSIIRLMKRLRLVPREFAKAA